MTTFEITITTLLALIAFALIFRDFIIGKALDQITKNQESQYKKLDFINTQIAGIWRGQDKIENNAAILSSIVEKMHRNLCVEIADKIVGSGFQNGFPPCYAPNGICTNPQMDCINCPKRGTGGSWSTSTNTIKEE